MHRNLSDEEVDQQFGYEAPDDEPDEHEEEQEEQENIPEEEVGESYDEEHEPEVIAQEIEEEKPKKYRDKAKTRINQIQREKYRALHEADRLRSEVEQLRQLVDTSSQVAVKQYNDNVMKRLEDARSNKIQALESGDPAAITDADARFTAAFNEMQQINDWKAQQDFERNQASYLAQQQGYQQPQAVIPPENYAEAEDWLDRNEWFNPESENFDQEAAELVDQYSQYLNQKLYESGHAAAIMSPAYQAELEKAREYVLINRNSPRGGGLNMKQSRGGANPVRRAPTQAAHGEPRQQEVSLTRDEKDFARKMGLTDKAYLAARRQDELTNGFRRRGGR